MARFLLTPCNYDILPLLSILSSRFKLDLMKRAISLGMKLSNEATLPSWDGEEWRREGRKDGPLIRQRRCNKAHALYSHRNVPGAHIWNRFAYILGTNLMSMIVSCPSSREQVAREAHQQHQRETAGSLRVDEDRKTLKSWYQNSNLDPPEVQTQSPTLNRLYYSPLE